MLPKITEEKIDENSSRFVIEPLYPGYGPTLGNAMRRVLLSSLPGTAITSFRAEGIGHEFTSIPHVKEDMVEVMINLKGLKLRSHSKEAVTLKLSKQGPGIVTSADFTKNSLIEIVDPSQHIASLDNKAKFDLEVEVEYNRGFKTSDSIGDVKPEVGKIVLDASFSPIERVKMEIENTRVGKMTNYDKLILEVYTNGAITAHNAIVEAGNVLVDHFNSFSFHEQPDEKLTEVAAVEVAKEEKEEIAIDEPTIDPKTKIEDTTLSQRTSNALLNAGIKTVAGMSRLSDLKLSEVKGLGAKGVTEIKDLMAKL